MRNNSCGGGAGTSSCEAMRRGVRESVGFARRRNGAVRLLPQRKRFPIGGRSHAAKDERRRGFEQGATTVFPLGFGAYDSHAIGAERKNREGRGVVEAWLAFETFNEWCKVWVSTNSLREWGNNVEVPKARVVCADVSGVFQGHEPLAKYVGADMEHVGNRFLDVVGKAMEVECDRPKRYDFHHGPDWWIVHDAVFGCEVLYLGVVGCLVRGISYSCKKSSMLRLGQFWHVCGIDVCKRIVDEIGVASGCYSANRNFNSRKCIHRRQSEVTVEHVDVPCSFKCGVGTEGIGIGRLEWIEIAGESVVANSLQYSKKLCRVGGESPTLKKSNKFFVGLWLLFVWSHVASQKRKIPVATIGRSLSGGVTSGMIPNILPWCKGANWQRKEN